MFEHTYNRPPARYHFTPNEIACILKTQKLLVEDLSIKQPSLGQLSKAAAINEFKLKAGFRKIIEIGTR